MLHGVLRGKFELSEDQLTSTVLAYLDLLPPVVFSRWLAGAHPANGTIAPLSFSSSMLFEQFHWPRTTDHGEPDLLVVAHDGSELHAIIVEAKYGAPKSQWSSLLDDPEK